MVVSFRCFNVGNFKADLVIDKEIIVEVKAIDKIVGTHKAQVINYLTISGLKAGFIINFGNPKVEIARVSDSKLIAERYFKKENPSYLSYPVHPDI